jgi:transposase InsO family protein
MSSQYKYTRKELEKAVETKSTAKKFTNLTKKDNDFFIGEKKVIPVEEHSEWLARYYDNPETGMRGRDALFAKISREYVGISRRDIESWLKNWETTQIHQPVKKVKISRPMISTAPMKCWGIDLTWLKEINVDSTTTVEKELKDSQCLLTVVDQFSKYGWVRVLKNKIAKVVAAALREIIAEAGVPSTIKSDNGSEFISNEFKAVCSEFNIKHLTTDTYSPQQNAISERYNRTIKMMVYKYQSEWRVQKIDNDALQKLVTNYNNCPHGTTKQVPAELHTQKDPEIVKAARGEIKDRAKKLIAESQQKFPRLRIGDTVHVARSTDGVWRRTRQLKKYAYLSQWFLELYKVGFITCATPTKNSMYKLLGPDHKEINRFFLRQDLQKVDPKKLQKELEKGEYVVEEVLAKKKIDGTLHYLVRFVGYPEPEWVKPQESFTEAIKKFQSKGKKQPDGALAPKTPAKKVRRRKEQPVTAVTPPVTQTRSGRAVKAPTRYG